MIIDFAASSATSTIVTAQCDMDGEIDTLDIPMDVDSFKEAIVAWSNGTLIQNAFPALNADQREFIKTGITPAKWDAMFGG